MSFTYCIHYICILSLSFYLFAVDVTNSFALPFEEDARDGNIYFLDHDYLEAMFAMHRKVGINKHSVFDIRIFQFR